MVCLRAGPFPAHASGFIASQRNMPGSILQGHKSDVRWTVRKQHILRGVGSGDAEESIPETNGENTLRSTPEKDEKSSKNFSQSQWNAIEKGSDRGGGADYLFRLGQSDLNLNIDTGQNATNLDSLFVGNFLGHKSDIADGSLHQHEFRSFSNLVGDYYVAPRFMEKVVIHIAKNYLVESFGSMNKIPLILGIWGPKGTGKTFQTELTFKKMGLEPIIMSAGELENEWAGTPGKLIRERYRRAAEMSRVQGKLSCLVINDIDAGIGRFANTQVTVNNQIVVGTLMNICDDPELVSIGQEWTSASPVRRTPIVVTGNDFSTLFAPLIRDGRMEKFYWEPTGEELVDVVFAMYKDDGLMRQDISELFKTFPNQTLDFFGALRGATYDSQIREWIVRDVVGTDLEDTEANMKKLSQRLLKKDSLPMFKPVDITLEMLLEEGGRLAREQQLVNDLKLSAEYMKQQKGSGSLIGFSSS